MIAIERLYINADRTAIVPEDSPSAAFLLAAEGAEVPDDVCRRYRLGRYAAAAPDGPPGVPAYPVPRTAPADPPADSVAAAGEPSAPDAAAKANRSAATTARPPTANKARKAPADKAG